MPDYLKVILIVWPLVLLWIAFVIFTNRKAQPRVLFWLFMVELWERFSYYGMRALLILYLTKALTTGAFGMPDAEAYGIYAAYGALVYLTPLFGGLLADKLLGFRKAITWGAILMAAGQFTLFTSEGERVLLFIGLGFLTIGNGFFKPNISSLIGKFYLPTDPRRDGAFTIFYMGINIGAFLAPLTCGAVGQAMGWKYGFLLAGCGMVAGLVIFLVAVKLGVLEDKAEPPQKTLRDPDVGYGSESKGGLGKDLLVYLGTLLIGLPIVVGLIYQNNVMDILLAVVGVGMISFMIYLSTTYGTVERQRIWVIVILLLFTTVFWTFFELAGSALSLFTDRNVNRDLGIITLETSQFQAVNPLFIMLFAPLFSILWVQLAKRKLEPPAPVKFAAGLLLLGAGFVVLNAATPLAKDGIIPGMFLIGLYLLHTLGELALSPVGLSLVTKLAPAQIVGFMMGFWFLSSSIAHQAGKWISNLTAVNGEGVSATETLTLSMGVFNQVGFFALGSGVLLLILSPIITKWMHGIR